MFVVERILLEMRKTANLFIGLFISEDSFSWSNEVEISTSFAARVVHVRDIWSAVCNVQ
jgi:hypothetical protein